MEKIKLAVLFGGTSSEHEVSLKSATCVFSNINTDKYDVFPIGITKKGLWYYYNGASLSQIESGEWENSEHIYKITPVISKGENLFLAFGEAGVHRLEIDCVFPVLHGTEGEDGSIQGIFEINSIPYVGCSVACSANCMDKSITKMIINYTNVKQANYYLALKSRFEKDKIAVCNETIEKIGNFPIFVKPCSSGSSVGVNKASDIESLIKAFEEAFKHDTKVLAEEYLKGKEIEVAILGNGDDIIASTVGEIAPSREFYSYEAKYIDNNSGLYIPARISEESMEKVRENAKTVFTAMGCSGLARVDFFYTDDGEIILNEINTLPGFTNISMYPKLFEYDGINNKELIDRLITLALNKG